MCRGHGKFTFRREGPFFTWPVPVKFNAVVVRIPQIKRLADAVVGRAFQWNVGSHQPAKRISESCACRIENRRVIKAGGSARRRRPAQTLPRVETEVVVISASGNEGGLASETLHELETEDAAVEVEGPLEL